MDVSDATQIIKEYVEEDYVLNREKIIKNLYSFFSKTNFEKTLKELPYYISEENKQKIIDNYKKLQNVQQLVEDGADKNDVLIELEIFGGSMDFLLKYIKEEDYRKNRVRYNV